MANAAERVMPGIANAGLRDGHDDDRSCNRSLFGAGLAVADVKSLGLGNYRAGPRANVTFSNSRGACVTRRYNAILSSCQHCASWCRWQILSYRFHMNPCKDIQLPLEAGRWPCCPQSVPAFPSHPIITLKSALGGTVRGWSYLRESVKLTVRARIHAQATRTWIAYWNSTPLLAGLANAQPAVLKKIYRPYLSSRLDCEQRLTLLISHYDFIILHGLGALVLRAAMRPVALAEFSGKSGALYRVELVAMGQMEREGELVLQLLSDGVVIYSVAFAFSAECATCAPSVAIGCLQGGRSDDALQKISIATRDMSGLRPKSLMPRLVQQIGHRFGCRNVMLVGNSNRVMQQQIRKGRVSADYDETWRELGATQRDDGDFALPCAALVEPDLATIASSKRSAARKRFALLASTAELVCGALRERSRGFKVVSRKAGVPDRSPVPISGTPYLVPVLRREAAAAP